jgi:hypothetical protein
MYRTSSGMYVSIPYDYWLTTTTTPTGFRVKKRGLYVFMHTGWEMKASWKEKKIRSRFTRDKHQLGKRRPRPTTISKPSHRLISCWLWLPLVFFLFPFFVFLIFFLCSSCHCLRTSLVPSRSAFDPHRQPSERLSGSRVGEIEKR